MTETEPVTTPPRPAPPAEAPVAPGADDGLPVTVIAPGGGGLAPLGEVWRFRELFLFLVWRDVKIRYKQTFVGVLWAVLQPAAVMGVLVFALGRVAGDPAAPTPYWLFVLAALVPWTFLGSSLTGCGMSVVANQHLVTKVYFPRVLLPLAAVGVAGVDCAVGGGLLAAAAAFGASPGWHLLALPLVVAVMAVVASGVGLLLAAVTVKYRDFRIVLPLLVQLWMFMTPAIYLQTGGGFGPVGEAVQRANPAHGVVVNFRAAALGLPFDWAALGLSAALGAVLFGVGLWNFRRAERSFADVI